MIAISIVHHWVMRWVMRWHIRAEERVSSARREQIVALRMQVMAQTSQLNAHRLEQHLVGRVGRLEITGLTVGELATPPMPVALQAYMQSELVGHRIELNDDCCCCGDDFNPPLPPSLPRLSRDGRELRHIDIPEKI